MPGFGAGPKQGQVTLVLSFVRAPPMGDDNPPVSTHTGSDSFSI